MVAVYVLVEHLGRVADCPGLDVVEFAGFLADVDNPHGFDWAALQESDGVPAGVAAVGRQALWFGMNAVLRENVSIALDAHGTVVVQRVLRW